MKHKNTGVAQPKMCTDLLTLELTKEEFKQVEEALSVYLRCQALLEYDNKHFKKVQELRYKVMVEIWNNKSK